MALRDWEQYELLSPSLQQVLTNSGKVWSTSADLRPDVRVAAQVRPREVPEIQTIASGHPVKRELQNSISLGYFAARVSVCGVAPANYCCCTRPTGKVGDSHCQLGELLCPIRIKSCHGVNIMCQANGSKPF